MLWKTLCLKYPLDLAYTSDYFTMGREPKRFTHLGHELKIYGLYYYKLWTVPRELSHTGDPRYQSGTPGVRPGESRCRRGPWGGGRWDGSQPQTAGSVTQSWCLCYWHKQWTNLQEKEHRKYIVIHAASRLAKIWTAPNPQSEIMLGIIFIYFLAS